MVDLINDPLPLDEPQLATAISGDGTAIVSKNKEAVSASSHGSGTSSESGASSDDKESDSGSGNKTASEQQWRQKLRKKSTLIYAAVFLVVLLAIVIPVSTTAGKKSSSNSSNESSSTQPATVPESPPKEEDTVPQPLPATVGEALPAPTVGPVDTPVDSPVSAPVSSPVAAPVQAPVLVIIPPEDPETMAPSVQEPEHDEHDNEAPVSSPTGRRDEEAAPVPAPIAYTLPPTPQPTQKDLTKTPLFTYLTVLGTPESVLKDPTTPQGKALRWLLQPDVMRLGVMRVSQRYALVALDYALHEPTPDSATQHQMATSWKAWIDLAQQETFSYKPFRQKQKDICDWEGITCNPQTHEVIGVKWSNRGLKGSVVPEITLLKKLKKIDLADNEITGTLHNFWDLEELTHMYLFNNKFSGLIPTHKSAPSKLVEVFLGHNQLTGPLPLTLASSVRGGPTGLRYLIVHHNKLSGNLPEGMRLRNLFYLDLSNNDFEGPVPSDWVFYFQLLRVLYLGNNRLSGELPQDWGELGNGRLKQLFIENNQFTGEFPRKEWNDYFMTNMNIQQNNFDEAEVCKKLNVFAGGEMVEFRADCDICEGCDELCRTCYDDQGQVVTRIVNDGQ